MANAVREAAQQAAEGQVLKGEAIKQRILIGSLEDDAAFLRGKLKQAEAEGQALREERDKLQKDLDRLLGSAVPEDAQR